MKIRKILRIFVAVILVMTFNLLQVSALSINLDQRNSILKNSEAEKIEQHVEALLNGKIKFVNEDPTTTLNIDFNTIETIDNNNDEMVALNTVLSNKEVTERTQFMEKEVLKDVIELDSEKKRI